MGLWLYEPEVGSVKKINNNHFKKTKLGAILGDKPFKPKPINCLVLFSLPKPAELCNVCACP